MALLCLIRPVQAMNPGDVSTNTNSNIIMKTMKESIKNQFAPTGGLSDILVKPSHILVNISRIKKSTSNASTQTSKPTLPNSATEHYDTAPVERTAQETQTNSSKDTPLALSDIPNSDDDEPILSPKDEDNNGLGDSVVMVSQWEATELTGKDFKKINDGKTKINKLLSPDSQKTTKEHTDIKNVINIAWYLYSSAIDKNQGFDQGTFVIEDPKEKIFAFLKNCKGAKERISSHFKPKEIDEYGVTEDQAQQYGIDMPEDVVLFEHKKTLLFGRRGTINNRNFIFIKPEDEGCAAITDITEGKMPSWEDTLATVKHAGHFVVARVRKFIPGADDQPSWRKERMPYKVAQKWLNVAEQLPKNVPLQVECARAATRSIFEMMKWEKAFQQINSDPKLAAITKILYGSQLSKEDKDKVFDALKKFNAHLKNKKYDNLEYRKGREVILLESELVNNK